MFKLVITAILVTRACGQQPSTVPAAQANTASVLRTSGNSALRLRQPASQPAFHYDALLSEEESNNRVRTHVFLIVDPQSQLMRLGLRDSYFYLSIFLSCSLKLISASLVN